MKITREQVRKLNEQLPEGWSIDLMQLLRGEKVADRCVKVDESKHLRGSLYFMERYDRHMRKSQNSIELCVSLWHDSGEGYSASYGMGKWFKLMDVEKKLFKKMCECAAAIDDDFIRSAYEENAEQLQNPLLMGV